MYIGIDIHKRHAQVAVIDDDGELVEEVRVKNANLDEIAQRYAGGTAAIEATTNYYHIHDTLSEYLDVTVGHPAELKLISDSDKKTDEVDARQLARLARLDAVPETYVPSEDVRKCRKLARTRDSLLKTRTEYVNKIHGVLADVGIEKRVKPLNKSDREFLEELSLDEPYQTILESTLRLVDTVTEEMEEIEAEIETIADAHESAKLMQSAPGVAELISVSLLGEIGDMTRFDSHKQAVSYIGLNPVIRESGDSRITGGISKKGSGLARYLLVQAAHVAVHTVGDPYLTRYYNRLRQSKSELEAMVATARKLLVSLYYMINRQETWNPPGVNS